MIRVVLPYHLRTLANVGAEVALDVAAPVTQRSILDALEARYPMLCGTIRDHVTKQRRPLLRFFACEQDVSHDSPDAPAPEAIATGKEAFWIVGAIAGGQATASNHNRLAQLAADDDELPHVHERVVRDQHEHLAVRRGDRGEPAGGWLVEIGVRALVEVLDGVGPRFLVEGQVLRFGKEAGR
jgi:hypothetical protein